MSAQMHIVDNLMWVKSKPNSQKGGAGSTNEGAGSSKDMVTSDGNPKAEKERSKKKSPDANKPKAGSSNIQKSKADKNNSSQRQRYHGSDRRMSKVWIIMLFVLSLRYGGGNQIIIKQNSGFRTCETAGGQCLRKGEVHFRKVGRT